MEQVTSAVKKALDELRSAKAALGESADAALDALIDRAESLIARLEREEAKSTDSTGTVTR